ncbi:hypothetical protein PPACK8108_LOCUS7113 [Phakopsora pachyrhizi]|uniref:Uncharacterized protein n=1 Tax=Phakopsora pachyrhizi TaxID=170000 RepID=A0AAV0ATZ2_PHAPC|nr:hypothetical protein PPACK8108_LOCUS7113 [Phakopsora pachyrhizi]
MSDPISLQWHKQLGKWQQTITPDSVPKDSPRDLLVSDVFGPCTPDIFGNKYILTIQDHAATLGNRAQDSRQSAQAPKKAAGNGGGQLLLAPADSFGRWYQPFVNTSKGGVLLVPTPCPRQQRQPPSLSPQTSLQSALKGKRLEGIFLVQPSPNLPRLNSQTGAWGN